MKTRWGLFYLLLVGVCSTVFAQTVADGFVHEVKIEYDSGDLKVFLDDMVTPKVSVTVNLNLLVALDEGKAWIGFTSATGDWEPNMDILDWSFTNGVDDFSFPDFSSVAGFSFVGSAVPADNHLRIVQEVTPAGAWYQTGAAWYGTQVLLDSGFSTEFDFQVTTNDPGADGFVFVIQTVGTDALGGCGYGLGYLDADTRAGSCDFYGDPGTIEGALAIEFDTYENSAATEPWPPEYIGDGWLIGGAKVGDDHIAVVSTVLFFDDFRSGDHSNWAMVLP